ncbi:uncharacterized protein UTRI_06546_B [Ustilago trichophora]|uniref:Uncharacterized protein n=1 Tax=Ustilago trichophora TaxID=86804 RepID=A0A5C3EPS3_9BASI|nr:uncharacterized protein UTRI_06546_B [Ustilago trichophora]
MKLNIFVALALSTCALTLAAPLPQPGLTGALSGAKKVLSKLGSGKSRKVEESIYSEGFVHDPEHPGWGRVPSPPHSEHKGSAGSTPENSPPGSPLRQPSTTPAYPDPAHRGGQRHAPAAESSGHFVGMDHMLPTGVRPHSQPSYGGMQYGGSTEHYSAFSQNPTQHAPAAYPPHGDYAGYTNNYPGSHGSYVGSHGSHPSNQGIWSPYTYRPGYSYPGQSFAEMGNNRHFMEGAPGQIVSPPRDNYPWSH